jgi:hypothetical protein
MIPVNLHFVPGTISPSFCAWHHFDFGGRKGGRLMNIFISYSADDYELANRIQKELRPLASVKFWQKDKELGKDAWGTIFKWIDEANLVIVLITHSAISRAMAIGQEIGHARKSGKKIIPIVAEGIPKSELGCLEGVTFEPLSRNNIDAVLNRLKISTTSQKVEIQNENVLAIFGVLALCLLFIFVSKE